MKYFIATLLLFSFWSIKANDTLTLAQAYNFNIGDTFDYKLVNSYTLEFHSNYYSAHFERDIIINQWSDSATHIVRYRHFSDTTRTDFSDTLTIINPQQFAFYSDTGCNGLQSYFATYYVQPNSMYNGRTVNTTEQNCPQTDSIFGYANGLGRIYAYDFYPIEDMFDNDIGNGADSSYIIYYSKGNESWGNPYYYELSVGIEQLTMQSVRAHLFPTINDGQFQIDVDGGFNYKLIVNDILGREVHSSEIQNGKNSISLKKPLAGIYLWRVMDNERAIQAGKFVVISEK